MSVARLLFSVLYVQFAQLWQILLRSLIKKRHNFRLLQIANLVKMLWRPNETKKDVIELPRCQLEPFQYLATLIQRSGLIYNHVNQSSRARALRIMRAAFLVALGKKRDFRAASTKP